MRNPAGGALRIQDAAALLPQSRPNKVTHSARSTPVNNADDPGRTQLRIVPAARRASELCAVRARELRIVRARARTPSSSLTSARLWHPRLKYVRCKRAGRFNPLILQIDNNRYETAVKLPWVLHTPPHHLSRSPPPSRSVSPWLVLCAGFIGGSN